LTNHGGGVKEKQISGGCSIFIPGTIFQSVPSKSWISPPCCLILPRWDFGDWYECGNEKKMADREHRSIIRSTFLLRPDGVIRKI
jgi:hypothetical protein